MPTARLSAVNVTTAAGSKARLAAVSTASVLPTGSKARLSLVAVAGLSAPTLAPIPDRTSEPLTNVTLTAVPTGVTPDSYTWRVVNGRPASIVGTGATVTVRTHGPLPPYADPLVIGVSATASGITSSEVQTTITVYPPTDWVWSGTEWVGTRVQTI